MATPCAEMPRLYLCPLDGIDDALLSRLLLALPAARRARALRYRRKERTVECAVAYHLVDQVLTRGA